MSSEADHFSAAAATVSRVLGSISVSPSNNVRTISVSGATDALAGSKLFGILPLLQRNSCFGGGAVTAKYGSVAGFWISEQAVRMSPDAAMMTRAHTFALSGISLVIKSKYRMFY